MLRIKISTRKRARKLNQENSTKKTLTRKTQPGKRRNSIASPVEGELEKLKVEREAPAEKQRNKTIGVFSKELLLQMELSQAQVQ